MHSVILSLLLEIVWHIERRELAGETYISYSNSNSPTEAWWHIYSYLGSVITHSGNGLWRQIITQTNIEFPSVVHMGNNVTETWIKLPHVSQ